ncbi:hypothetical protein TNCV_891601 [Trichonephila clavipes]|nr:hypothetical protein TNCV_891601 [Trichonephila clavipes]
MVFSRTPPARNPELNFSKKHQDDPFGLFSGTTKYKMKSCQDMRLSDFLTMITAQFKNNVMLSVKMPKSKNLQSSR